MLRHRPVLNVIMLIFGAVMLGPLLIPVSAFAEPVVPPVTPERFIERYEASKQGATVAKVEAYGQEALKLKGAERLTRLLYVVEVLQGLEVPETYKKWFNLSNRIALDERQNRFIAIFAIMRAEEDYFSHVGDVKYYDLINNYTKLTLKQLD